MDTQMDSVLPFFDIQCDWEEALSAEKGKCWFTIRKPGEDKSFHGELRVSNGKIEGPEKVKIKRDKDTSSLTLHDEETGWKVSFVSPLDSFSHIHKAAIVAMDVTEGGLGVSVCKNNELKVWETQTGKIRRTLAGHELDAYHCRFFPSGIVILSGGADCKLKIWSAETGDCPVTLTGHTGSIQQASVVERGKNIISVSKDGTAKLWDCGEARCLATLLNYNSPINTSIIFDTPVIQLGKPIENMSEREVGTKGKLLIVGCEDGVVSGISIASRQTLFTISLGSAVNSLVQTGTSTYAAGTQNGKIFTFDVKNLKGSQKEIDFSSSPAILDLCVHPRTNAKKLKQGLEASNLFWASKNDGTTCVLNPNNENSTHFIQLTGPNFDPVYQIRHDGNYFYTACRDGVIRKYSINRIAKILN